MAGRVRAARLEPGRRAHGGSPLPMVRQSAIQRQEERMQIKANDVWAIRGEAASNIVALDEVHWRMSMVV
jgi:hypothetical protein